MEKEMQKSSHSVRKLCTAAFLMAVGVLLPQAFHLIGGSAGGSIFLPMHIPVLISGLLLGPFYGAVVGIFTPAVSFLFTAMPPAAKLPFMIMELFAYGVISGFLAKKLRFRLYPALCLTMVSGRLVYALALWVAGMLLSISVPPVVSVWTAFITGIPGMVLQLVAVPVLVNQMKRVIGNDQFADGGKEMSGREK